MAKMTSYRLLAWGRRAEFADVEIPQPGAGEVLLKMAAVGLCGSDIHIFRASSGELPYDPPFTLGHENAGWVAECGPGTTTLKPGMLVLASCVNSCGRCEMCLQNRDQYCERSLAMRTRGIGMDGGLADYLVVPQHLVLPLRKLSPVQAAPLADAGGTSYHAAKYAMEALPPGATALVIGAGGLGSFAIQYLRHLSGARIIVADQNSARLAYAERLGADATLVTGPKNVEEFREISGGHGADAVLDFVGTDATMQFATAVARPLGRIVICGMGNGVAGISWGKLAPGCRMMLSIGFSLKELREVVALAENGRLVIDTEVFPFNRTPEAYGRLERGELQGRAVVTIAS